MSYTKLIKLLYVADREALIRWGRPITGDGALSVAETELLDEIFKRYGHLNRWDLVKLTHSFPEWHDPQGGSIRTDCRDILEAGGLTERPIVEIEEELQGLTDVTEVLHSK